jgi:hypothetical protein
MATYYIDFAAGDDTAIGTDTSHAWRTIPGTRNTGNTDWIRANAVWGPGAGTITQANKVSAGTVFVLKAGTTHDSTNGGMIRINSTYYDTATVGNPITIQVSNSWGSGNVTIDGTGITIASWTGLIAIDDRNYIYILGDSNNHLIIRDATERGINVYGSNSPHLTGFHLRYVDFMSCASDAGLNLSYCDDFEIRDCTASLNNSLGFCLGGVADQNCNNGSFIDCVADDNGQGEDLPHGFGQYGSTNITYLRCESKNHPRDGFDFGTSSDTHDSSAICINCIAHDNGEDGFAGNGGTAGIRTFYYINCISYHNSQDTGNGGFMCYSGYVTAYYYHCISANNGVNWEAFDEGAGPCTVYIKNCIGYKPVYMQIECYHTAVGGVTNFYNDYNLWVPSGAEPWNHFAQLDLLVGTANMYLNGTSRPTNWTTEDYSNIIEDDEHSLWNRDPDFDDAPDNDYHIGANSWCLNAGIYLSSPTEVLEDKDGISRSDPPEIGAYEYIFGELGFASQLAMILK